MIPEFVIDWRVKKGCHCVIKNCQELLDLREMGPDVKYYCWNI